METKKGKGLARVFAVLIAVFIAITTVFAGNAFSVRADDTSSTPPFTQGVGKDETAFITTSVDAGTGEQYGEIVKDYRIGDNVVFCIHNQVPFGDGEQYTYDSNAKIYQHTYDDWGSTVVSQRELTDVSVKL